MKTSENRMPGRCPFRCSPAYCQRSSSEPMLSQSTQGTVELLDLGGRRPHGSRIIPIVTILAFPLPTSPNRTASLSFSATIV